MPVSYLNGFSGDVVFAGATLNVTDWSISIKGEALDTTNTGDLGWESNILGAKSWDGSFKAFWDSSTIPTGAGFTAGARGTGTFKVGSSGKTYAGTVQLTDVKVDNPVKGVVSFECTFKGSGSLTYAS